jgi:hypothetical protein
LFFVKLTSAIFINSAFEMAGGGLLTKAQRIWFYVRRTVDSKVNTFLSPAARPPRNWLRLRIFRIVTHPFFETGVTIAILLNLVSMLDRNYTDSSVKVYVVDLIDSVFLLLYYVEMLMRIFAIGPQSFAKDPMNIFDLFVNVMSAIDFFSGGQNAAQGFQILRAVRVLRLFKILKKFKRMRLLMASIVVSVPYFLAAMCITMAFLVLCAVLMSGYFHSIKFGHALNSAQNFRGFLASFNTMFIAFFSGEWANLLPELSVTYPYCTPASDATNGVTDCGSPFFWIAFLIFQWVCMFFITPLFLGMIACVVLQLNDVDRSSVLVSTSNDNEDELCIIPESDYNAFFEAWELVDPAHIGLVRAWRIKAVVCHLVGRKISDFAPRGSNEWRERLDFIVYQSVLATNNVKYLKSSSKVKSEKDVLCGFATQYVHIREVLMQTVMMVQHKCHIDSPLIQYAPWLRGATDIVSSIASQEVRSALSDLKHNVEQKGTVVFTPTPGNSKANFYEIMAANIVAAARSDPEDHWLNLKTYSHPTQLTHRSQASSASEVQQFRECEEVDDEEQQPNNAHLAGLDAFEAMLMDMDGESGSDADDTGIDWEALCQDEDFLAEPSDSLSPHLLNEDAQEAHSPSDAAADGSSLTAVNLTSAADNSGNDTGAVDQLHEEGSGGFNPLDFCASSRVDVCASNRSNTATVKESVPADAPEHTVVVAAGHREPDGTRPTRERGAKLADDSSRHATDSSGADHFFLPSIFRRCNLFFTTFRSCQHVSSPFCFIFQQFAQFCRRRCDVVESESVCFYFIHPKFCCVWLRPLVHLLFCLCSTIPFLRQV